MSNFFQNTTPAERSIGCSLALTFESNQAVVADRGVISGEPVVNFGATVNGATDYFTFGLDGSEFDSDELSIAHEFIPYYPYDEDAERYLIDTTNGSRYAILKRADAANNVLRISLGNSTIADIPSSTYGPFWLLNRRNVIVISSDASGSTNVWLNGNAILINDTSVWVKSSVTELYVASSFAGISLHYGCVSNTKLFKSLLTEQDAINFYTNKTYRYMEDATSWLPMDMQRHDPSNADQRTLDISGNLNHGILGDGSTPSSIPTKTAEKGYPFDGVSNYIEIPDATSIIPNGDTIEFTLAIFYNKVEDNTGYAFFVQRGAGGAFTNVALAAPSDSQVAYSGGSAGADIIADVGSNKGLHTLVITYAKGSQFLYFDGLLVGSKTDSTSYNIANPLLRLGGSYNGTNDIKASILEFQSFQKVLSPLQVADLHHQLMEGINNV